MTLRSSVVNRPARPLLLFDIDQTLVYVSLVWLHKAPCFSFRLGGDVYHVYVRPGAMHLWYSMRRTHVIGVWTAATRTYAICVLRHLFGRRWQDEVHCLLHRRHCRLDGHGQYVKDLRALPKWLAQVPRRVYLVDDNPVHATANPPSAMHILIPCRPFLGHHLDTEAMRVGRLLRSYERFYGHVVVV